MQESLRALAMAWLLLITTAGSAGAVLQEMDLLSPGDGLVLRDAVGGLDWMKFAGVNAVTGDPDPTYNEVVAALPGVPGDPWRYATTAEVTALMQEYAAAGQACGGPREIDAFGLIIFPQDAFQEGAGGFCECLPFNEVLGVFDDGNPLDNVGVALTLQTDGQLPGAFCSGEECSYEFVILENAGLTSCGLPVPQDIPADGEMENHFVVREPCPNACDDSDACTTDICDTVLGCQHGSITCEDLDDCTVASCDAVTGCAYTPVPGCTLPDPPPPDHLIVLDLGRGTVFATDPATGDRAILSSPSVGGGDTFAVPRSIVSSPAGRIFVHDPVWGAVVEVDPDTGDRSVVSGCEDTGCTTIRGSGSSALFSEGPLGFEDDASLLFAYRTVGRLIPGFSQDLGELKSRASVAVPGSRNGALWLRSGRGGVVRLGGTRPEFGITSDKDLQLNRSTQHSD